MGMLFGVGWLRLRGFRLKVGTVVPDGRFP